MDESSVFNKKFRKKILEDWASDFHLTFEFDDNYFVIKINDESAEAIHKKIEIYDQRYWFSKLYHWREGKRLSQERVLLYIASFHNVAIKAKVSEASEDEQRLQYHQPRLSKISIAHWVIQGRKKILASFTQMSAPLPSNSPQRWYHFFLRKPKAPDLEKERTEKLESFMDNCDNSMRLVNGLKTKLTTSKLQKKAEGLKHNLLQACQDYRDWSSQLNWKKLTGLELLRLNEDLLRHAACYHQVQEEVNSVIKASLAAEINRWEAFESVSKLLHFNVTPSLIQGEGEDELIRVDIPATKPLKPIQLKFSKSEQRAQFKAYWQIKHKRLEAQVKVWQIKLLGIRTFKQFEASKDKFLEKFNAKEEEFVSGIHPSFVPKKFKGIANNYFENLTPWFQGLRKALEDIDFTPRHSIDSKTPREFGFSELRDSQSRLYCWTKIKELGVETLEELKEVEKARMERMLEERTHDVTLQLAASIEKEKKELNEFLSKNARHGRAFIEGRLAISQSYLRDIQEQSRNYLAKIAYLNKLLVSQFSKPLFVEIMQEVYEQSAYLLKLAEEEYERRSRRSLGKLDISIMYYQMDKVSEEYRKMNETSARSFEEIATLREESALWNSEFKEKIIAYEKKMEERLEHFRAICEEDLISLQEEGRELAEGNKQLKQLLEETKREMAQKQVEFQQDIKAFLQVMAQPVNSLNEPPANRFLPNLLISKPSIEEDMIEFSAKGKEKEKNKEDAKEISTDNLNLSENSNNISVRFANHDNEKNYLNFKRKRSRSLPVFWKTEPIKDNILHCSAGIICQAEKPEYKL